MPFIANPSEDLRIPAPDNVLPTMKTTPRPKTWDVAASAYRQINSVASAGSYIARGDFVGPREDFNYDSVTPLLGTQYEPFLEDFYDADSDQDVQSIKNRIDAEQRDRQILADGGGMSLAFGLLAGITDPLNFVAGAGFITKGVQAAKFAKGALATAKATANVAGRSAVVGASSAIINEASLQASQEIRPLEESLTNIGVATVLSGVLGGASTVVSKALRDKVAADLTINDTPLGNTELSNLPSMQGQSVGAAFAGDARTLEDLTIKGTAAKAVAKGLKRINPQFNLAQSPSLEVRKLNEKIQSIPFLLNQNEQGIASPISFETKISMYQAPLGKAKTSLDNFFKAYSQRIKSSAPDSAEARLDFKNFKEQVSLSMTRGDVSDIPEVQMTAKFYRDTLFNPIRDEGIAAKVFPEDVKPKNAAGYFPQMYDRAKINTDRQGLRNVILQYLPGVIAKDLERKGLLEAERASLKSATTKKAEGRIKTIDAELEEFRKAEALTENSAGDLEEIADEIIGHIYGFRDGVVLNQRVPLTKGPLKNRTLDFIPQEDLRPWSNVDVEDVAARYTRNVVPDIEIRKIFSDGDLTEEIAAVNKDYNAKVNVAKNADEVRYLEAQRKNDIADINALIGRGRGTFGRSDNPDSLIQTAIAGAQTLTAVSQLGGIVANSIPDLGRLIGIDGLLPVLNDCVVGLAKNFKTFKLSAAEAKEAGIGWEVALQNGRYSLLADLSEPSVKGNRIRMGFQALSDNFSRYTLSNHYESARKQGAAVLLQGKMTRDIEKWANGKLGAKGVSELAKGGIDEAGAKRINAMLQAHATKAPLGFRETTLANTGVWTDKGARDLYLASLNKQTQFYATIPGLGTKPRWASSDYGRLAFALSTFTFAATSHILVSSMQTPDAKTLGAITGQIALGMAVYVHKEWAAGRDPSSDPATLFAAGIDNSGILGIFSEANNRLYGLSGGNFSTSRLIGAQPTTFRPQTAKEAIGAFFGPPGVLLEGGITGIQGALGNPWTYRDTRAIRKMLPFQNLTGFRFLVDELERGVNEQLGVKNP